jgi:hypothetical protein
MKVELNVGVREVTTRLPVKIEVKGGAIPSKVMSIDKRCHTKRDVAGPTDAFYRQSVI